MFYQNFHPFVTLIIEGTIIKDVNSGVVRVIVKGSYERIGQLCNKASIPADFKEQTEYFASEQFYVLGMGIKTLANMSETQIRDISREDAEEGIDLSGLLLFRNEMKEDSAAALHELRTIFY